MLPQLRRTALPLLAIAMGVGGCDALTGSDSGNTTVLLSRGGSSGASFSISAAPGEDAQFSHGGGGGTANLALVEEFEVTITAVQALQAASLDMPDEEGGWRTLTLSSPLTIDLMSLPFEGGGLEVLNGDLAAGPYVRLRFLVSEAHLVLASPLTLSGRTFPAGEEVELRILTPWVSVPGSYFVVDESDVAVIEVVFDPASSFGQVTVTQGDRLTLLPVFHGRHSGNPPPWVDGEDDDDDDD